MQGSLRAGGRCCLQHLERTKQGGLQYGKARAAVTILGLHKQSDNYEGVLKEPNIAEILTETWARTGLMSWVVRKQELLDFRNRYFDILGMYLN